MSIPSDMREIVRRLRNQGWTVESTNGGHFKAIPPDKSRPIVHFSGTPSDWRGIKNTVAELVRSGYVEDDAPRSRRRLENTPLEKLLHVGALASMSEADVKTLTETKVIPPELSPELQATVDRALNQPVDPLDAAYQTLKEARAYFELANTEVEEASRKLEAARMHRIEAGENLAEAKRAFDQLVGEVPHVVRARDDAAE